jgi:hypothetical protein
MGPPADPPHVFSKPQKTRGGGYFTWSGEIFLRNFLPYPPPNIQGLKGEDIYILYIFYRYSPPARPAESTTTIKPLVVRKLGRCQMKIKWFYSQREWNSLRYFHCFANVPFPFPMQCQWLILCCIMLCFQIVVPLQTCCERARSARCVRQERATNRVWTVINIY